MRVRAAAGRWQAEVSAMSRLSGWEQRAFEDAVRRPGGYAGIPQERVKENKMTMNKMMPGTPVAM